MIDTMELDGDRPFLEQFEEMAMIDNQALEWLCDKIYDNPRIMSLLSNFCLATGANEEDVNYVEEAAQIWKELIPHQHWPYLDGKRVITAGFGAGPGCIGQKVEHFDPPISLDQGLIWIERWRKTFKKARLMLDDGGKLKFDPNGFVEYERGIY